MPTEFLLFPPPYERDKESIIYAKKALIFYLGNYPKSKNAKEAKKMLQKTINYLASYQFYVGNFYFKREKYNGAIRRFQSVIQEHPDSSFVKESMYKIIISYIKLEDGVNARKYNDLFAQKYPKSGQLIDISELIKKIPAKEQKINEKTTKE
jgi:outer membrane protein assembly factor BamD